MAVVFCIMSWGHTDLFGIENLPSLRHHCPVFNCTVSSFARSTWLLFVAPRQRDMSLHTHTLTHSLTHPHCLVSMPPRSNPPMSRKHLLGMMKPGARKRKWGKKYRPHPLPILLFFIRTDHLSSRRRTMHAISSQQADQHAARKRAWPPHHVTSKRERQPCETHGTSSKGTEYKHTSPSRVRLASFMAPRE